MAMDFAKLDFAVSFNPATAFPLDARTYFESLNAASAAASSAVEVGSSDGIYYIGQTLTVVENEVASFYIIQPDKTLKPVAGAGDEPVKVLINDKHFAYTEGNILELKGAAKATEGQVLAMDATGNLAWVTPVDSYSKTETDEKINSAVAAAAHLKRKIVDSIELIDKDAEDALQYIYMVKREGETLLDMDHYDEYLVIDLEGIRYVEKVGDWTVDLSDYAKKTDLEDYVAKEEGKRLITDAEGEKIAEAEKNVINSVSADFVIDEARQLTLNNLPISKITDLQTALNSKVDAQEGYKLLSPDDQSKLEKLVVGEDGQVGISGTINASNVKELDQWVSDNRNDVNGLFNDSAKAKLDALFDQTSAEFEIATIGGEEEEQKKQLNLVSISQDKVSGLSDALGALATKTEVTDLEASLNAKFANYVLKEDYDLDIAEIKESLTWKDLDK